MSRSSRTIGSLNPAPQPGAYGDFLSAVQPGKAAWDWWSGLLAGMKPDMADLPPLHRLCGQVAVALLPDRRGLGLEPANSATTSGLARDRISPSRPRGIDVEELIRMARPWACGILLWTHWQQWLTAWTWCSTPMRLGRKGVKIDFLEREDQEMVAFYQRVAEATAARDLLLDSAAPMCPPAAAQLPQLHHPGGRAGRQVEQDDQTGHAAPQPDAALHAHAGWSHRLRQAASATRVQRPSRCAPSCR